MFVLEFNYTVVKVLLAASFLGFTSGILGVFIILKKQALIGDALSHTTLPGIALVYLFARSTDIWVLWLGAILASFVTLLLMELIKKYSKIKSDTALSLVLASFFGFGNVLIAIAQNTCEDNKIATLEKFILGQIALLTELDMISTGIMALITLVVVVGLWKEFKIYIFDDNFAQSVGFNIKIMTFILNLLLIGVVVTSLKIIGIILTSAFFNYARSNCSSI
ncbi:metal ABC transporter permease [New Jersey aster yellows phytoplasma]|uniref:metal ABC transporter permease n=1 Tax=New Jersey aster yellows phytoplasma TaxID=270520 RepID=UPI002092E2AE|nr:iron chelate uptake ABC transporter family permease subunit [New Jersey aster yellows phytoplasma]